MFPSPAKKYRLTSDKEDNFIRMFNLVTGVGTEAVRCKFDQFFPPTNLAATLIKEEPTLKTLHYQRIINANQMTLLLPSCGAPSSTDFDVTLMICLIRNLTSIPAPKNGYEKLPHHTETSTASDLARIKYFRNLLAHKKTNKIKKKKFSKHWTILSEAIVRVGGTIFQPKCDEIKTAKLINANELQNFQTQLLAFRETFSEDIKDLQVTVQQLQKEQEVIPKHEAGIQGLQVTTQQLQKNQEVIPKHENDIKGLQVSLQQLQKEQEVIPKHEADINKLQETIKAIEADRKEWIPQHIRDLFKEEIKQWEEDDGMYVSTSADINVLKCLENEKSVTITGNAGMGKSALARHVCLVMQKKGYAVLPTYRPEDIRNWFKPGMKTLFFIDDIGGRYTLNYQFLNNWTEMMRQIQTCMKDKCFRILSTCRLQVYNDEKFNVLKHIFKVFEYNIKSADKQLNSEEKACIAKKYLTEDEFNQIQNLSDKYDFFPLLCRLYSTKKHGDLLNFFNYPLDVIREEMESLLEDTREEGQQKFCSLALCVMFNNKLTTKHLMDGDGTIKTVIEDTLDKCNLNRGTPAECLIKSLSLLQDNYVTFDGTTYKIIHDKIFDILSKYIGERMIEIFIQHADSKFISERFVFEIQDNVPTDNGFLINIPNKTLAATYIGRIISDWSNRKVVDVFSNTNMNCSNFRTEFLNQLEKKDHHYQQKLVQITDNHTGDTPFLRICCTDHTYIIQWLINKGVPLNQVRSNGSTPLCLASQFGHKNVVKLLLQNHVYINKCMKNGTSPLQLACCNNCIDVVQELLKCDGIDIDLCDNEGRSSLWWACLLRHVDIVRLLLHHPVDINKCEQNRVSPLLIACYENYIDVVQELLKCDGIDIDLCDNEGCSPLWWACHQGHVHIVRLLLRHPVDIHKCREDGTPPLHIACYKNRIDVVQELLECDGIDIGLCDNEGRSSFWWACQEGHVDIVRLLLQHQVDINKCRKDGTPPLQIACYQNRIDVVQELLECDGIDIDLCDNEGRSSLWSACLLGHVDIVRLLLHHPVDINKCEKNGFSPLQIARYKNHIDVVQELLKCNGIDIDLCDNKG